MTKAIAKLGKSLLDAKRALALSSHEARNQALESIALLLVEKRDAILSANAQDIEQSRSQGVSAALLDRLRLSDARIAGISEGVREMGTRKYSLFSRWRKQPRRAIGRRSIWI